MVAERLLGYAGLAHLRCSVRLADTLETVFAGSDSTVGGSTHHTRSNGAAAWFAGIDGDTCIFGVEPGALHDPEALVAALAHEVAHAYRATRGLVDSGPLPEEPATDVTTVYLGFGILTTNASDRLRTTGRMEGVMTVWASSRQSLGYLPPQAFAFLLGAQAVARDAGGAELRRVRSRLETNQSAAFDAAVSALRRERPRLLRDLGLEGSCSGTPAPTPDRRVAEPKPGGVVPDPRASQRPDNRGRRVFRVTGRSYQARGNVFLVGAVLLGVGLWLRSRQPWWIAAGIVVGVVLRSSFGGARSDVCSDPSCQADLAADRTACPRCGGTIAGAITDPDQRLDHPAGDQESAP